MEIELFSVIVNKCVKWLLIVAWIILEFNGIVWVFIEIWSKIFRDSNQLQLIKMSKEIKDSLSYMDRVSDNNDIGNVRELSSLINLTSDCE